MNTPTQRLVLLLAWVVLPATLAHAQEPTRYVRYATDDGPRYGEVVGETVHELVGSIYEGAERTGDTERLAEVQLLAPIDPGKVIAVGLNYRSHLGGREVAEYPGLFAKMPTSIVGPGADIVLPADATNVHYEGELVIVIGRRAKNVSAADAHAHIFGVTAGNDVSERNWQGADLQWFRAKASDTFGPTGPMLVAGLDYNDLHVETRVNGEVRQAESSADLIFSIDEIVSYISRYVTLEPGDAIFTGTPGSTRAMRPGDVIEIEVQGVGVLQNSVVQGG